MIPACCDATIDLVQRLGRSLACPVCDERYLPDAATRPALVPEAPAVDELVRRRGAQPDARVSVATEAQLRPSSSPAPPRESRFEERDLVRVRRLLTELRPDKAGPLGWAADALPPVVQVEVATPPMHVQTSIEVPAILPGAFIGESRQSRAPRLDGSFLRRGDERDGRYVEGDELATLRWLQRAGTLHDGRALLYQAAALALAPTDVRDRWAALPIAARRTARAAYGHARVTAAEAAWWGDRCEGLTRDARCGDLTATPPPSAVLDVCPDPERPARCSPTSRSKRSPRPASRCARFAIASRGGGAPDGPASSACPAPPPTAAPSAASSGPFALTTTTT